MGDGYDFFASVRDGVSIQHAFSLTNLVLVVVLVVKSKAPYFPRADGAKRRARVLILPATGGKFAVAGQ